jgi:putative inorganic carbon (HCO3(-)) transporter
MQINKWLSSRFGQSIVTLFIIIILFIILWILSVSMGSEAGVPFWESPSILFIPFAIGLLPPIVYAGFLKPYIFCLIFFSFSIFRLHEVFPLLLPFQLPFIFGVLGTLSLIVNVALGRIKLYWRREMSLFLFFFLLITIGVFLAYDFELSYLNWQEVFVRIFIIFFLVTWAIGDKKEYIWLLRVMISCGLILAYITIYNKTYKIGLIEGTRASIGNTLSTLDDPNDLALTLLIPFSFCFSILVTKSNFIFTRILGLLSSIVIFDAIIATQSRGGLLGLVGVLGYFLSYRIKSKLLVLILAILFLIFIFTISHIAHREIGGTGQGFDESTMGRINAWRAAFNMALHHPIFGVGLNGFRANYYTYAVVWDRTNHSVHSSWFEVLAESGFPGLFLFILCIYCALKATRLNIQKIEENNTIIRQKKTVHLIMLNSIYSGLIGYCISSTFLTQGFSWPFYIYFALSISLTHSVNKLLTKNNEQSL